MEWHEIEGKWGQLKGKAKQHWSKLTDDDLSFVKGKKEELVNKIEEKYGIAKDQAEKQVERFANSFDA